MYHKKVVIDTRTTKEFRCRVCLETSSKMYPLQGPIVNCDVDISTMLCYCASVEIPMSSDLPSFVCIPCFKTIRIAYNFIKQFRENNKKLIDERLNVDIETSELGSKDYGSTTIYQVINDGRETSDVIENVNTLDNNDTFLKSEVEEVEIYGTDQINQVDDDYQFVYGEISENLQESDSVETDNCEIETEFDTTLNTHEEQGEDNLMNHTKVVPRVKIKTRYVCPLCPEVYFASDLYFENHMLKHKDITFYCNHCQDGIIYNDSTYIKHFQDVHKHQCPYCHKSCPSKSSLYAHLRSHSNVKYWCNYKGCSKVFNTNFGLKKHETVHSEEVKHVCEECGLEFKTYDTYRYHQKKHGGRKFLCTQCGRTFMQSVHLKYHMWLHTGVKQFKCDMCDKSYTSVTQLKKHKRRHHPSDMDEGNERFLEVQT